MTNFLIAHFAEILMSLVVVVAVLVYKRDGRGIL